MSRVASNSRQPPPADITAELPGEEEEQCRDITEEEDIMVGDDMEEDIGRDMVIDNSSNKNSHSSTTRRTSPGST